MVSYEKIKEYRNKNNQFARLLGIQTVEIKEGFARGEMEIREQFQNVIHSVHGGCLFALADTIGGAAAASYGYRMTTISSDFHYLTAAVGVQKLFAEAKEIKYGKKISVYDVEIKNEGGTLIAKGTFSYFNFGDEILPIDSLGGQK